jgi:solute carrier family 35, member F5
VIIQPLRRIRPVHRQDFPLDAPGYPSSRSLHPAVWMDANDATATDIVVEPGNSTWALTKWTRRALGIVIILCVVCIWVGSSLLIQSIFEDVGFNRPFFLTYFTTAMFLIYMPVYLTGLGVRVGKKHVDSLRERRRSLEESRRLVEVTHVASETPYIAEKPEQVEKALIEQSGTGSESVVEEAEETEEIPAEDVRESNGQEPFSFWDHVKFACFFCPMWFLANYTFNISLSLTSVSSNTVISATCGFWTLLLCTLFRIESLSPLKLCCTIISLLGVILIVYSDYDDDSDADNTWIGDIFALVSAVGYALYASFFKWRTKDESRVNTTLFLGLLGLVNVCSLWVFFPLLSILGLEAFSWPSAKVLVFLIVNGVIGTVLSDWLWLRAVLLTSPLVVSVGMSLTIPLAIFADMVLHPATIPLHFSPLYILGFLLIITAFVALQFADKIDERILRFLRRMMAWILQYWASYRQLPEINGDGSPVDEGVEDGEEEDKPPV